MWFIKSPLRKQIDAYGKDTQYLVEFARSVEKAQIEEITLEDIKSFYTSVVAPTDSLHTRNSYMLAVRKFFRYYRGENILKWQEIKDNPLSIVENIAILPDMPKEEKKIEKKRGPGRPRDIANIKKAVVMRNEGIPYRRIALALGKDPSQIVVWIRDAEKLLS